MMQMNGERYAHGQSSEALKLKFADELADILSLVLFIAHEMHIDIDQAWKQMLESDEVKFSDRGQSLKPQE